MRSSWLSRRQAGDVRTILPDVLAPGLVIVFCGTAAGTASARRKAYYAGPGNAFWPTLFEVGLTPRRLEPEEYASVRSLGLGLTDLAKQVSGADRTLLREHFDRGSLLEKIGRYRPRILAFTSKRAAEECLGHAVRYGLLPDQIRQTRLVVLPSPSGAARRYWDVGPWHDLARMREAGTRSDGRETM
jgi:TDG/mug DNA glycosylase family protein